MQTENINLFEWDDYHTYSNEGFIFTYNTLLSAELPIRDFLNEQNTGELKDPSFETQTFGYFDCLNLKEREIFVKKEKKI